MGCIRYDANRYYFPNCVFVVLWTYLTNVVGNTVILALGASTQPTGHPHAWLQALLAISFFIFGSFFTAQVTTLLHPLRNSTLALSFLLQTCLIITAAALVQGHVVPGISGDKEYFITLVPLPMLSFQAAMQSVTSRQLGLNEIPTTVLTSVYCDLGNDDKLFAGPRDNWKRNRRVAAAVLLILGAIIGGWLSKTSDGMSAALWFAAGVKACLAIAWFFWREEKSSSR
jgi:uncharacterized membrane protein YoaK (UPF0700 family)